MARKSFMYSVLEAVQHEMRQDPNMIWIFELTAPVASTPGRPVINLEREFGRKRVVNTGIDENWMAGCVLGAGLAGSRAATYIPYQGNCMCFQMLQNHAGKLRSMTGGDAEMPVVFILEMTGQTPGFAGQHSDYEIDTYYAHIPGLKTVVYGGAPMYLADIQDALAVLGQRFVQIYGQGESPMTITALARQNSARVQVRRAARGTMASK
ncbi:MAG: hypothetical protein M5U07_02190 [Xanthobacteraceae bacterium]|nr:hypothetical protein [Xanthobacteraceae bacterium]